MLFGSFATSCVHAITHTEGTSSELCLVGLRERDARLRRKYFTIFFLF